MPTRRANRPHRANRRANPISLHSEEEKEEEEEEEEEVGVGAESPAAQAPPRSAKCRSVDALRQFALHHHGGHRLGDQPRDDLVAVVVEAPDLLVVV